MALHPVGDQELGILRPPVAPLGLPDLFLSQRLPVGCAGVLFVGGAVADVGVHDDERGAVVGVQERLIGARQRVKVVGVAHPKDVPPVAQELRGQVIGEGQRGVPFDRDVVVVVDPAQLGKPEVPGHGRSLLANPLHHASVPADRVDVVVEHRVAVAVEVLGHPPTGDGHANAVSNSLPERPGRRLHA